MNNQIIWPEELKKYFEPKPKEKMPISDIICWSIIGIAAGYLFSLLIIK